MTLALHCTHIPQFGGLIGRCGDYVVGVRGEDCVPDPALVLRLEERETISSPAQRAREESINVRGVPSMDWVLMPGGGVEFEVCRAIGSPPQEKGEKQNRRWLAIDGLPVWEEVVGEFKVSKSKKKNKLVRASIAFRSTPQRPPPGT